MSGRELTGNHYLSFPVVQHGDAAFPHVSALHSGLAGLLVWQGDPLFRPVLEVDDREVDLSSLGWDRLDRWIPQAQGQLQGQCEATLTICAPAGYDPVVRGAFLDLQLRNRAARPCSSRVSLEVHWRGTELHARTGRPLAGESRLAGCADLPGVALEAGRAPFGAALAIAGAVPATRVLAGREGGQLVERQGNWECTGEAGRALIARVEQKAELPAGGSARFTFYLHLGRDRDSALGGMPQLSRLGPDTMLRRCRLALSQLGRKNSDPGLNELLNRNLLFNHFFGLGRGLDDDRLHAVSSRSPLHGPTAWFNEREALLWTLPAVTLNDPYLARELLLHCFEVFSGAPAQPGRYIDGGVLSPGFVLDQLLAYPLALDRYTRETGDGSLVADAVVQDVLREVDAALYNRLHREVLLAETELLSPDQPADFPYPTFGNVLLWCYARSLSRIWERQGGEQPPGFEGGAEEIAAAIWQRCTVEVDRVPVLVSSTDLEGQAAVYDDPSASLALLPYLGFCEPDDPTWRNSMELLRSSTNPLWHGSVPFPGLADRRTPRRAALAALLSELLGPERERALATLRSLQLTDGVASDYYDPQTGATAAGPHAAALAGLCAWAIDRGTTAPRESRRNR